MTIKILLNILLIHAVTAVQAQNTSKTYLFVGTYTEGQPDKGIYVYEFNSNTGSLKLKGTANNITNPSYLSVSPNGGFIYACTDTKLPSNGSVSAFKIDSVNGKITFINKQNSAGSNPVYVSVHDNNRCIINANYTQGNVSVFTTNADGSINPASQVIQFTDSSINKLRQEKAHVHAAVFSPDYAYVFFPDLGADKIRVFKFDPIKKEQLISIESNDVRAVLGSGPRHFTFHPNGQFAYCIEELSGMISAYSFENGTLDSIQRIFSYSKLQPSYAGADIHVSPDGRFLYASNRGSDENTISIFSIDQKGGRLKLIGHQSTFGGHPRNFTIDPTGRFLLVANLETNNIVVFRRDLTTGLLSKTKHEQHVPRPSCLQMRTYSN